MIGNPLNTRPQNRYYKWNYLMKLTCEEQKDLASPMKKSLLLCPLAESHMPKSLLRLEKKKEYASFYSRFSV